MKKVLSVLSGRLGFFIAIIFAAAVGGTMTTLVRASIPDSDGIVHSCYSNPRGSLYVIDSASQSCGTGETALNLAQAPSYAYIRYDGSTASLDTGVSHNGITVGSSTGNVAGSICLAVSGNPKVIQATPSNVNGGSGAVTAQIRGYYQSSSSGTNTTDFDYACNSGSNVMINNGSGGNYDLFVLAY
jgi:hypothetical protein